MSDATNDILRASRQHTGKVSQGKTQLEKDGGLAGIRAKIESAIAGNAIKRKRSEDPPNASDHGKSDSEAETVVLAGKGDTGSPETKKTIEHRRNGTNGLKLRRDTTSGDGRQKDETKVGSLKRKRPEPSSEKRESPDGANSSLSSRYSSPVHETTSSRRSLATSERSRSSPPYDDGIQEKVAKPTKRKHRPNGDARGRSDQDTNLARRSRKHRDVRSATHDELSTHRSVSPHLPQQIRAQSSQAEIQGTGRRRKPPLALNIEQRRKASEDPGAYSDDATPTHNIPPLRTAGSVDQQIMSARAPHKKNRDKSGRTLLAKACNGDVQEAEARLRDRPGDIDIADYAGNTPLQIASLAGSEDIVQLLIREGCDIHCKNVDSDTPLIDAVENGHLEVVKVLLDAGVDPRQGNKVGAEPLELLSEEHYDYDNIRDALFAAVRSDTRRRQSRDNGARAHDDQSTSAGSPTDQTPMSAFPGETASRRRTARSQPTRGDTLYTHATPEALRDAAAKGDAQKAIQILQMGTPLDTEAMIAAAKGGHDEVLELMIAMFQPDIDPDPVHSASVSEAQSTPVLAAIGRKNVKVLKLLVSQPGFDPTRRLLKGKTYHELAEDRQGVHWQQERSILLKAYEQWKGQAGNHGHDTPRKLKRRKPVDIPSSPDAQKKTNVQSPLPQNEPEKLDSKAKRNGISDQGQASDAPAEPGKSHGHNKRKKFHITDDSTLSLDSELNKPRRRLMSKNEIESNQEQRRASLAAEASPLSERDKPRKVSDPASPKESKDKIRHGSDSLGSKDLTARPKRPDGLSSKATSVKSKIAEPSGSGEKTVIAKASTADSMGSKDSIVKHPTSPKKRPRVSDGDHHIKEADTIVKKRRRTDSQTSNDLPSRPQAPMLPSTSSRTASDLQPKVETQPKAAPVAFMGGPSPPLKQSITSPSSQQAAYRQNLQAQKNVDEAALQREFVEETKEIILNAEKKEDPNPFVAPVEKSPVEQEKDIQAASDAASKAMDIAPTVEAAKEEARQQAEQAEEQLQREREEREKIEEEELQTRKAAREEEERKRQLEEEATAKRLEQQRRQAEEEEAEAAKEREALQQAQRIAREEQEKQERERVRQRELEAQEQLLQRQRQAAAEAEAQAAAAAAAAAEERRRLESLPGAFQHAASMPFAARTGELEILRLLPLKAARMADLHPDNAESAREQLWISNLQAALILGGLDLELRDYPTLPHRSCLPNHLQALWETLRRILSAPLTHQEFFPGWNDTIRDMERRGRTCLKSLAEQDLVFWIPLEEFLVIAKGVPHLSGGGELAGRLKDVMQIHIPMVATEGFWDNGGQGFFSSKGGMHS